MEDFQAEEEASEAEVHPAAGSLVLYEDSSEGFRLCSNPSVFFQLNR